MRAIRVGGADSRRKGSGIDIPPMCAAACGRVVGLNTTTGDLARSAAKL
jgi:hypothetical protein